MALLIRWPFIPIVVDPVMPVFGRAIVCIIPCRRFADIEEYETRHLLSTMNITPALGGVGSCFCSEVAGAVGFIDRLAKFKNNHFVPSYRDGLLLERSQAISVVARAWTSNFHAGGAKREDSKLQCVVIPGSAGLGKSRMGFAAAMDQSVRDAIDDPDVKSLLDRGVTYIFVDFANGSGWRAGLDAKVGPTVMLGVRLACYSVFECKLDSALGALSVAELQTFDCGDVLAHIIGKGDCAVAVHLDEFQLFGKGHLASDTENLVIVRDMLLSLSNAFRDSKMRVTLLPIISGTAARDIRFAATEKLSHQYVVLTPLTMDGCLRLCENVLGSRFAAIAEQSHFLVALADAGGIPRYVNDLIRHNPGAGPDADWGFILRSAVSIAVPVCDDDDALTMVTLALLRTPIKRDFRIGASTVANLERDGVLFLLPTHQSRDDTNFVVHIPLVQMEQMIAKMTGHPMIPVALLRGIAPAMPLSWSDFEVLHAHVQCLRFTGLARTQAHRSCTLSDVFPGAVVGRSDPVVVCGLWSRNVCTEAEKFLVRVSDIAAVVETVTTDSDTVNLRDVVAISCVGNAMFDGRMVLADRVIAFWQDKHSLPTSADRGVSRSDISSWYEFASACTARWRAEGWRVILFFCSNRRLTAAPLKDDDALFSMRPGLIVVTRDQLTAYLTPTFAERGILLPDAVGRV